MTEPTDPDLDALGGIVERIDRVAGKFGTFAEEDRSVLLRLLRRAVHRPPPLGGDPTNVEVLAAIKAVDERMRCQAAIREALRRADDGHGK